MNRKLYDLMNWPEIEGIVYSECNEPGKLLGGHVCKDGFLIQAFRPDAVEMTVTLTDKKKSFTMEKVDEAGYFSALLPGRKVQDYTLTVENLQGKKETYIDCYSFPIKSYKKQIAGFMNGCSVDTFKWLGSHVTKQNNTKGVLFQVWAPNAIRVSVVGEFNHWDGRIHQMNRMEQGIYSLFIPELSEGTEYYYEIKMHGGQIAIKVDPFAHQFNPDNNYVSVVTSSHRFVWQDANWQESKGVDKPISIYEIKPDDLKQYSAVKDFVSEVKSLGFTHVEFMPICEYIKDETNGYETLGYYALSHRYGSEKTFCNLINELHKAGIGVIADWNAAFMSNDRIGLKWFDGAPLYESCKTQLDHSILDVSTFDYSKPQIRSFLASSMLYWLTRYHIDGIRIDQVASMLYLNYGKGPGEWKANIYGGYENLDAVAFIKYLRKLITEHVPGTLLIAEESSAWPKVTQTAEADEESLGFDYKWNTAWKQEFVQFMSLDPLFRKGKYDDLINTSLYQYSENFIQELSHNTVTEDHKSFYSTLPGNHVQDKLANLRVALGYLYTIPGKKLISSELCGYVKDYISALNQLYLKFPQLSQYDQLQDGFSWMNHSAKEETVISFIRHSQENQDLLIVINFTPVVRSNYRLGVDFAGKYKEVFNSDDVNYGGDGNGNESWIRSDSTKWQGHDFSISVTLPSMSMLVFTYMQYTSLEKEEIRIKEEAAKVKQKADAEAGIAEELKLKAEADAKEALEAEKQAKLKAQAAIDARIKAEKKAEEAEQTRLRIDQETSKKLEELHRKMIEMGE